MKDSFLAARLRQVPAVPKPDKPAPEKLVRRGGARVKDRPAKPAKEAEDEAGAPEKPGLRRMLNEEQVLATVPVSRATLFRMIAAKKFPRGTFISANRRIWFEDEIIAWQNAVDEYNPNRRRGVGGRREEEEATR